MVGNWGLCWAINNNHPNQGTNSWAITTIETVVFEGIERISLIYIYYIVCIYIYRHILLLSFSYTYIYIYNTKSCYQLKRSPLRSRSQAHRLHPWFDRLGPVGPFFQVITNSITGGYLEDVSIVFMEVINQQKRGALPWSKISEHEKVDHKSMRDALLSMVALSHSVSRDLPIGWVEMEPSVLVRFLTEYMHKIFLGQTSPGCWWSRDLSPCQVMFNMICVSICRSSSLCWLMRSAINNEK